MFKKKQKAHFAILNEKYVPSSLPKYGLCLDTFITSNYRNCSVCRISCSSTICFCIPTTKCITSFR